MNQGIQRPEQKITASRPARPDWHDPAHPGWDRFCQTMFPKPLTEEKWEQFKSVDLLDKTDI